MNPRFVMVGGFLGAGKTTTVGRLAKQFQSDGLKVGIVTNDQTTDLVDTQLLRSQGFDVGEVAGSCFCCNFNELTSTVERLGASALPDVILAEPVGSCTDLVATVLRPLTHVYQRPFRIAPYGVILKPSHGTRILRGDRNGGFSPKAEYIFRKQLEEADFIIINRIDELPVDSVDELEHLLDREFPGRPIVRVSARTGAGFDLLHELLDRDGAYGRRVMDVDYDVYAEGEAELGWLNCQVQVSATHSIELDALLMDLIRGLHAELVAKSAETAHLKAIGLCDGSYAVANAVSNATEPELSLPSNTATCTANVVVNARVAIDPVELESLVRSHIERVAANFAASCSINTMQSFRPGRPVPTHRLPEPG